MDSSLMVVNSMQDIELAAKAMAASGFFQDTKQISQAMVKIMAGREMGFGPFASMTGINIIVGKPSIGANLMAAAVKAHPKYDYRVKEMTDTACEIAFFEGGAEIGRSRFTIEDARKAGTKNLDRYPRNMLFARAISNGVRWYTPDVFMGAAVYTPEELGASVDENGDMIIDGEAEIVEPASPAVAQFPAKPVKSEPKPVQPATPAAVDWSNVGQAKNALLGAFKTAGITSGADQTKWLADHEFQPMRFMDGEDCKRAWGVLSGAAIGALAGKVVAQSPAPVAEPAPSASMPTTLDEFAKAVEGIGATLDEALDYLGVETADEIFNFTDALISVKDGLAQG